MWVTGGGEHTGTGKILVVDSQIRNIEVMEYPPGQRRQVVIFQISGCKIKNQVVINCNTRLKPYLIYFSQIITIMT